MSIDAIKDDRDLRRPALPELPEPGRVVEVRGATWAVADVRDQGLPRSPADEGRAQTQHVVTLQSLEEDRLGQELSVIWELEVGQTVVPDQGLPETINADAFDDPNTLGAFVDAVRWGAVTSARADAFQAPFRSGANVEAYQLEPLRRALEAPRTNLLLADDVGLGKTIEAGLVIQELLLRHRARTGVIVCPPSLRVKWRDEMREKFGLEFVIVDSHLMSQVRRSHGLAANPFRLFPRVIVSMAWLPTARAQRLLRDVLTDVAKPGAARRYAFDLLVVDEAHHVAPSSPSALGGGRGYALDSQRTIATRALAECCEHRLFLSATPHNGYTESFTALMEMIDGRRFSRGAVLDESALSEVTVRRLKTQIEGKNFHPRAIKTIVFDSTPDEEDAFTLLHQVLTASAGLNGRRSMDIVALLLKKRLLSSPWAFARTLGAYVAATSTGHLPEVTDGYYAEVLGSEQTDEEEGLFEQPEFAALRQSKRSDPLVGATSGEIDQLLAWGESYEHKANARVSALLTMLDAVCRPDGNTWSNERVVVFTEYTDTLAWIVSILQQKGYADVVATIQGSTPDDEREQIKARFTAPPTKDPVRVLVATDAAGEGIDLQAHCHRLVNFDVPFNPSRLEQRIGRIDRYGQRHAPEIYHFTPSGDGSLLAADLRFMRGIAEKIERAGGDLGSINPVIDQDLQHRFGGKAPVERPATKTASKGVEVINRTMSGGLELNRKLTELTESYAGQKTAMHLSPFNARRVVDTALRLDAQLPLVQVGSDITDADVFEVPALGPKWQAALAGLDTKLTPGELRPITFADDAFDDEMDEGRDEIVHVHLGHALLQKSARQLRSALFGSSSRVHRVTAVVVPDIPVSCAAAVSRVVLVGRGGLRLHEEVFVTGIRFKGQALAEEKVNTLLDRVLDRERLQLANDSVRTHLSDEWNAADSRLRARLETAMRRRAETRRSAVTANLNTRRDSDLARAQQIFAAFRANLRDSLRDLRTEEEQQLAMLWSDDQQRQRIRDIEAMERRLLSLDEEESRELAGIRERYADVRPFVSAAAVVFAITPEDAREWGDR